MDSVEHDIEALRRHHADLERQIEEENRLPRPDDIVLRNLKVRKLRVKDRIALY
jgi:hypothetical protein